MNKGFILLPIAQIVLLVSFIATFVFAGAAWYVEKKRNNLNADNLAKIQNEQSIKFVSPKEDKKNELDRYQVIENKQKAEAERLKVEKDNLAQEKISMIVDQIQAHFEERKRYDLLTIDELIKDHEDIKKILLNNIENTNSNILKISNLHDNIAISTRKLWDIELNYFNVDLDYINKGIDILNNIRPYTQFAKNINELEGDSKLYVTVLESLISDINRLNEFISKSNDSIKMYNDYISKISYNNSPTYFFQPTPIIIPQPTHCSFSMESLGPNGSGPITGGVSCY